MQSKLFGPALGTDFLLYFLFTDELISSIPKNRSLSVRLARESKIDRQTDRDRENKKRTDLINA